jgi:hypothetical protein
MCVGRVGDRFGRKGKQDAEANEALAKPLWNRAKEVVSLARPPSSNLPCLYPATPSYRKKSPRPYTMNSSIIQHRVWRHSNHFPLERK